MARKDRPQPPYDEPQGLGRIPRQMTLTVVIIGFASILGGMITLMFAPAIALEGRSYILAYFTVLVILLGISIYADGLRMQTWTPAQHSSVITDVTYAGSPEDLRPTRIKLSMHHQSVWLTLDPSHKGLIRTGDSVEYDHAYVGNEHFVRIRALRHT